MSGKRVEYIPLRHYYHRHTRAIFWELKDIIHFGNDLWFRVLLGWLLPVKIALLKLTQTEKIRKLYETMHVVQDMLVPMTALSKSLDVFEREYKVYPLWLCPMRVIKSPAPHRGLVEPINGDDDLYVDIGAYGVPATAPNFDVVKAAHTVEKFVIESKGFQVGPRGPQSRVGYAMLAQSPHTVGQPGP